MEWDIVFKLAMLTVPILLAIMGYIVGVLKMLHHKNEVTASEISNHRVEVAEKYLPRNELVTIRLEMKSLEDRLDKRFDRMEQWMGRRFDAVMGHDEHPAK